MDSYFIKCILMYYYLLSFFQFYFVLISGVQLSGYTILYTLYSVPPNISSTHLAPHVLLLILI